MSRVLLLIGTRKGAFFALSDASRSQWELKGPFIKGIDTPWLNLH
jgi:hypothetical protein